MTGQLVSRPTSIARMAASRQTTEATGAPANSTTDDLIGRTDELTQLDETVGPGDLVQLVGPPGIGKSTLARAFLARQRRQHDDDWLVLDARPAGSIDDAVANLAANCDVDTDAVSSTSELAGRIGTQLESQGVDGVLLDNAEDFAERIGILRTLVEAAFGVAWLATTRQPLEPTADRTLQIGALAPADAATLYRTRAARHWLGTGAFSTDDDAVARLVDQLEGHPLALETAAARINAVPPGDLADRLHRDGDGASGLGAMPALGELFGDALAGLDPEARRILEVAAVFADTVPHDLLDQLQPPDADGGVSLTHLEQLVRSGWLRPVDRPDGGRAYRLPGLLEGFVRRQLEQEGRLRATTDRHARTLLEHGRHLADRLVAAGDRETVDRLRRRAPELLAIFDREVDREPERAAVALLSLRWLARLGYLQPPIRRRLGRACRSTVLRACSTATAALLEAFAGEVRHRSGQSDSAADLSASACKRLHEDVPGPVAVEVYIGASLPLTGLDLDEARRRLEAADDHARHIDHPVLEARLDERRGFLALNQFELQEARQAFRRAKDTLRQADNRLFLPPVLTGLGYVAHRLDMPEAARNSFREAVRAYADTERPVDAAGARFNLGVALLAAGDLQEAHSQLERAADALAASGRPTQSAAAHLRLGLTELELGYGDRARTHLRDALETAQRAGDRHNLALAEATLALLRDDPRGDQFTIPLRDIHLEAEPDAAAAFLAYAAVRFAADGRPEDARRHWHRLVDLESLLGPDDHYLRHVVTTTAAACRFTLEALQLEEIASQEGANRSPADLAHADNPFARLVGRAMAAHVETDVDPGDPESRIIPAQGGQESHLRVHRRGHWFVVDRGDPVDLTSRDPLRRILGEIVDVSQSDDRGGASVEELIEAGWPEAEPTQSSGANRVYYTIRKLRERGLEDILVTGDDGYQFADSTKLRISSVPFDDIER